MSARQLRATFIGLVAIVLMICGLPGPAQAAPKPPATDGTVKRQIVGQPLDDRNLSANQKADVRLVVDMRHLAINGRTKTLDYKKADKYDRGRTTGRRIFAAHYLWAGGHVSNISKAELSRVKKYTPKKKFPNFKIKQLTPKKDGNRIVYTAASKDVSASVLVCEGQTKLISNINGSKFWVWQFFDSCWTDVIIALPTVAGAGALLSLLLPGADIVGLIVAACIAAGVYYLQFHKDHSSVHSIVVEDHWHLLRVLSQ